MNHESKLLLFELYWPPTFVRKYGYETTGRPAKVTVIAVDA
jgi:hypothetical protein